MSSKAARSTASAAALNATGITDESGASEPIRATNRLVCGSAVLVLPLQAWDGYAAWSVAFPWERSGVLLQEGGFLALLALGAWGVWRSERWGSWLEGVLAALYLALAPLTLLITAQVNETVYVNPPLSVALTWAKSAVFLAFLIGLLFRRRTVAQRV